MSNLPRIPRAPSWLDDPQERISIVRRALWSQHGADCAEALKACMDFDDTPQGADFWGDVASKLAAGQPLPLEAAIYLRLLFDDLKNST